jgi:outer membrane lipopolysaccharide assembly protein LptE/RlpB
MTARLLLLVLFLSALGGCGYHLPGRGDHLPAGVETLRIELFANRTVEPYLENRLTNAVTDRFIRGRALRLTEDPARADAVLTGSVTAYATRPISYDRNDQITEYRSAVTIAATLRRASDGRVLWKGTLDWTEEYPASLDKGAQEENEAAAIEVIAARLADELFFRIMEGF